MIEKSSFHRFFHLTVDFKNSLEVHNIKLTIGRHLITISNHCWISLVTNDTHYWYSALGPWICRDQSLDDSLLMLQAKIWLSFGRETYDICAQCG